MSKVSILIVALVVLNGRSVWAIEKPFLFAVKGRGQTSFILGSIHSKIALSEFPKYVLQALESRKTIAKEIVMFDADSSTPEGEAETQELPVPSPRAAEALRARGIPSYLFRSPFICSFYYTWEAGETPTLDTGVEIYARKLKKRIVAFDSEKDLNRTHNEIKIANDSCDIESATAYVSVEDLEKSDRKFLADYRSGDLSRVANCDDDPPCTSRTLKWIGKFERLHRAGLFAVVGVAHLVGPNGMLHQLKSRGYEIEQVTSQSGLRSIKARQKFPDMKHRTP